MILGVASIGVLALIAVGIVCLLAIWLFFALVGALFGSWFVSSHTAEDDKSFNKETMADIFGGRWERQEKKENK